MLISFHYLYPFYSLSRKLNPCTPHLHRRLRTSMAGLHVRRISSPPSAFQDPTRDRAFVAADPSLQDPDSNLTFTLFVNGFWSKSEQFLLHSHISHFFVFCFFCFGFSSPIRKTHFSILCLLLRQYLIYNPNIHALHSRNLEGFSRNLLPLKQFLIYNPFDFSFFLTLCLVAEKVSED